jgi:hypothetical protein
MGVSGIKKLELISDIGRKLQEKFTFDEIDSYLNTYQIKTKHNNEFGSKWSYIKEVLPSVDGSIVLKIAEELELIEPKPPEAEKEKIENTNSELVALWGHDYENKYKLFISHKHSVQKKCKIFSNKLKAFNIECFVAHDSVTVTKPWQDSIEKALQTCDGLLAILTEDFYESDWTEQEVGAAIGRNIDTFSINLGSTPLGFLNKFQSIPFKNIETDYKQILSYLIENENILSNLISMLEDCVDYHKINDVYDILELKQKKFISDFHAESLVQAFNKNKYLSESYKFGGSIRNPQKEGIDKLLYKLTNKDYSGKLIIPK